MGSVTARRRASVLVIGLLGLAMLGSLGAEAKTLSRPSGGKGVAHRDGRTVAAGPIPTAVTYALGHHALEPTLGIAPGGDIFYAAAGFDTPGGALAYTDIMRSESGGANWEIVSPRVLDQNTMPVSLDPYVWIDDRLDGDTARIYTIDLTVACSYLAFSDDDGASWTSNPLACGRPVNDHQTLFGGPPASSPTVSYPNILYYCYNDVASSQCTKSLDGGVTFHPTGSPAFTGYKPGSEETGFFGAEGFCGGLHGHGVVGDDGTVLLPREYCGEPYLAISHDEGLTWNQVRVSKIRSISQPDEGAAHPSVAVDSAGNIYYSWIGQKDRLLYLSVSKDGGEKWSKPVVASVPALKETNLPQIDVRGNGKIAIAYYGSENSKFQECGRECDGADYLKTKWNGYITISADALAPNPTFFTGTINTLKDPLVRQGCGPGRCKSVFDFIDVEIGPDGIPYAAFVDDCMKDCTALTPNESDYEGLISKLVGGPSLR